MSGDQPPEVTAARAREAIGWSGLSQRRVAEAIGIDETKLSKALAGRRRFTAEELLGLATATGVTVRWILGDESQVSALPPNSSTDAAAAPEEATPRRTIAEAAWTLFGRHGFDAVRIADIAEATGVSTPSIHYYFANKAELFDAALDYSVKLAFDRQIAWLADIDDPSLRLDGLLALQSPLDRHRTRRVVDRLRPGRVWLSKTQHWEDYPLSYERWSRTVQTTLEDGQRTGCFRPGDARAMADELTSLLDGLGIKVLTGVMDAETFTLRLRSYLDRSIMHTNDTTDHDRSTDSKKESS